MIHPHAEQVQAAKVEFSSQRRCLTISAPGVTSSWLGHSSAECTVAYTVICLGSYKAPPEVSSSAFRKGAPNIGHVSSMRTVQFLHNHDRGERTPNGRSPSSRRSLICFTKSNSFCPSCSVAAIAHSSIHRSLFLPCIGRQSSGGLELCLCGSGSGDGSTVWTINRRD